MNPTLKNHPRGGSVGRILSSAFNSADPAAAVKRYLHENPLSVKKHVFAFGLGKAACAMTQALADSVNLSDALIITKHASRLTSLTGALIEGNHPIPGDSSLAAGRAALEFVAHLTPDDLLICLISGGGSALMTMPLIPLAELQSLTSALLSCGARIDEINTIRRHLDRLKGGGLAQAANGAQIISLILSDVVGDFIEAIASGPTAPDPSTKSEAIAVLRKYGLEGKMVSAVQSLRETAKPGDAVFENVQNQVIGSNEIALRAAQKQAEQEGFQTKLIQSNLHGEAREVGFALANRFKEETRTRRRPFCLLAGGETTVTIQGRGRGGRNQELVLGTVDSLKDMKDVMVLSIATDGEDGPTDAAGALATNESAFKAESHGMRAADFLSGNDAYAFFDNLGGLIRTGPSGTNVNDLVFCLAF